MNKSIEHIEDMEEEMENKFIIRYNSSEVSTLNSSCSHNIWLSKNLSFNKQKYARWNGNT
jgi:hypothetical protein